MPYSLLCYIACVLYSTGQGVICIRCYIASYMATTNVPDDAIEHYRFLLIDGVLSEFSTKRGYSTP